MHGLGVDRQQQRLGIELAHAARARGGEVDLSGALLEIGHQFGKGLHRHAGVHDQHIGLAAQDGDVLEVLDRVVAQVGLHQRIGQVAALRRGDQRIAVGLGARDELCAYRAARAGFVFHDDGHAQGAAQRFGVLAGHDVDRAAGRERHDQRDGAGRVFVSGESGQRGGAGQAHGSGQQLAARSGGRGHVKVGHKTNNSRKAAGAAVQRSAMRVSASAWARGTKVDRSQNSRSLWA